MDSDITSTSISSEHTAFKINSDAKVSFNQLCKLFEKMIKCKSKCMFSTSMIVEYWWKKC